MFIFEDWTVAKMRDEMIQLIDRHIEQITADAVIERLSPDEWISLKNRIVLEKQSTRGLSVE